MIFGVCYRPPNKDPIKIDFFINSLYASFDIIGERHDHPFILQGDFNDRCQSWESNHDDSEIGLKLYDLLNSFNLSQIIVEPTRGINLLDLIITNKPNFILDHKVCDPFDNIDHCPLYGAFNIYVSKETCYRRLIRSYNDSNLKLLDENLRNVPWHVLLNNNQSCDEMCNMFTRIIQDELSCCIPSKEVLIRPRDKPGMTSAVRSLFRKCHRFHKIAQRTKNEIDIEKHREARKTAKKAWHKAKENYFAKMKIHMNKSESNQKYYWKYIKSVMGESTKSIPILENGGKIFVNDLEKCEALNLFRNQILVNILVQNQVYPDLQKMLLTAFLQL